MNPADKKMNKDIVELTNTINQLNIMAIYRPLYPTTTSYIFFSSSYEHSPRLCFILCHKTNLNKFKGREIIQCLLSDHSGINLKIDNRKTAGKSQNIWRLNTFK